MIRIILGERQYMGIQNREQGHPGIEHLKSVRLWRNWQLADLKFNRHFPEAGSPGADATRQPHALPWAMIKIWRAESPPAGAGDAGQTRPDAAGVMPRLLTSPRPRATSR